MSTANFIIIEDGTNTISDNPLYDHPDRVEFPEFGAIDADFGLRPLVTYQFAATGDVTLTMALNRAEVVNETYDGTWRMMSEVVNHDILQANGNELIVSVTGPGIAYISDLVLWYRQ
jgi:hypothetical protein